MQIYHEPRTLDVLVFENDYVAIYADKNSVTTEDWYYGYAFDLIITNKTDTTLMVSADSAKIGDKELDPFWAYSIFPDCVGDTQMGWSEEKLTEASIDPAAISEITLVLNAGTFIFLLRTISSYAIILYCYVYSPYVHCFHRLHQGFIIA